MERQETRLLIIITDFFSLPSHSLLLQVITWWPSFSFSTWNTNLVCDCECEGHWFQTRENEAKEKRGGRTRKRRRRKSSSSSLSVSRLCLSNVPSLTSGLEERRWELSGGREKELLPETSGARKSFLLLSYMCSVHTHRSRRSRRSEFSVSPSLTLCLLPSNVRNETWRAIVSRFPGGTFWLDDEPVILGK